MLRIKQVNYSAGGDAITLYNPNSFAVSTLGYSISDTSAAPHRFAMPVIQVQPGEELTVYCDNYDASKVLRNLQTDFNLSKYETLYLYHSASGTDTPQEVDAVYLPNLHPDSLFVRNLTTGKFYEVLAEELADH